MPACATKALSLYQALRGRSFPARPEVDEQLAGVMRLLKAEWDILEGMMRAAGAALRAPEPQDGTP
jgi:hypothetical protein